MNYHSILDWTLKMMVTMTGTAWVITSAGMKSVGIFSLLMPHEKGNDKNRKIGLLLKKYLLLKKSEMRV